MRIRVMGGCYFVLEHFLLLDFFMGGGKRKVKILW